MPECDTGFGQARFLAVFFLAFFALGLAFDAPGRGMSAVGFTLPKSRTASRADSGILILSPGRGMHLQFA